MPDQHLHPLKATPVQIVTPKPSKLAQAARVGGAAASVGPSRLATPAAFLMLLGLGLVYFALHGWDKKYGTFSGAFAGAGGIPQAKRAAGTAATATPSSSRSSGATTSGGSIAT